MSVDFILLFISAKVAGVKSDGAKGCWHPAACNSSEADRCLKQSFKKRGNNV
jgi:hypothetical protein